MRCRPARWCRAGLYGLALLACPLQAAVITVGPQESVRRIADAARLAKDGDTVLIQPGTYAGDVAVWRQKSLEIRGIGARPVLDARGTVAEGKAIWVFSDGDFKVSNIAFRGARAADYNGAGIRFERGRLEVRDCLFEDNEMGLLTANFEDAALRVLDSEFRDAPRDTRSLHHLLYVGRIAHLSVEGSRFHGGYQGHLVKSRARRSEIRYNLLVDGKDGRASYELEFPEGGVAVVVGNVIGQGADSANPTVLAYGAEGSHWPENRLLLTHNTLISEGWRPALFARTWGDRLPADTRFVVRNNLTVGLGLFTLGLPGGTRAIMRCPRCARSGAGGSHPGGRQPAARSGQPLAGGRAAADSGIPFSRGHRAPGGAHALGARGFQRPATMPRTTRRARGGGMARGLLVALTGVASP
jgi:hypothetical protein